MSQHSILENYRTKHPPDQIGQPRPHRVHVNVAMMRFNEATGSNEPVLNILPGSDDGREYELCMAHEIIFREPGTGREMARLVYRPNDKLPGGASAYIVTCALALECVGDRVILPVRACALT